MKKLLLLLFIFLPLMSFCQKNELYKICYEDRVQNNSIKKCIKKSSHKNYNEESDTIVFESRQKKIAVKYIKDDFYDIGVLRCISLAINIWEDNLDIISPISILIKTNSNLNDDVEIRTTVYYALFNNRIYPKSLSKQLFRHTSGREDAEIEVNPNIDWLVAWPEDSHIYGSVNLKTMLLRHIAHALGFGTSIVRKENGSIGYSVRDLMSPFDYLITNKSINMSQTIDLENFFRQDLFLSTKEGLYPLYTTEKGFVQGVSGCYFSFSDDKLLDYDIKNESKLMYIDKQTLNVLSEIGWKVKDYDLTLQTKNLDETYFGNIYDSLCFSVLDNNGNQLHPLIWEFQAFNRQLRRYDTLDKSFETCYSLSLEQQEQDYLDESTYLQGNVFFRINKNGIEKKI